MQFHHSIWVIHITAVFYLSSVAQMPYVNVSISKTTSCTNGLVASSDVFTLEGTANNGGDPGWYYGTIYTEDKTAGGFNPACSGIFGSCTNSPSPCYCDGTGGSSGTYKVFFSRTAIPSYSDVKVYFELEHTNSSRKNSTLQQMPTIYAKGSWKHQCTADGKEVDLASPSCSFTVTQNEALKCSCLNAPSPCGGDIFLNGTEMKDGRITQNGTYDITFSVCGSTDQSYSCLGQINGSTNITTDVTTSHVSVTTLAPVPTTPPVHNATDNTTTTDTTDLVTTVSPASNDTTTAPGNEAQEQDEDDLGLILGITIPVVVIIIIGGVVVIIVLRHKKLLCFRKNEEVSKQDASQPTVKPAEPNSGKPPTRLPPIDSSHTETKNETPKKKKSKKRGTSPRNNKVENGDDKTEGKDSIDGQNQDQMNPKYENTLDDQGDHIPEGQKETNIDQEERKNGETPAIFRPLPKPKNK